MVLPDGWLSVDSGRESTATPWDTIVLARPELGSGRCFRSRTKQVEWVEGKISLFGGTLRWDPERLTSAGTRVNCREKEYRVLKDIHDKNAMGDAGTGWAELNRKGLRGCPPGSNQAAVDISSTPSTLARRDSTSG